MRVQAMMILGVMASVPGAVRADNAVIKGTVKWTGPARAAQVLPVTQDAPVCGKSKPDETLLVDGAGGLRNVVVSLVGVAGAPRPAPVEAKLDQRTCQFSPHVQAVPAGSSLAVGNSDAVLHNVHAFHEGNTAFNLAMPTANSTIKRKLAKAGLTAMRCDAGHTWMSAYVWAFDHPYFAVTDAAGHFSIADVPPGSYTLHVWHEGWKRKGPAPSVDTTPIVVERPVTVETGKAAELVVELK